MTQANGKCDTKFHELRALFDGFLRSGDELGASICVNLDGEDVIDLWGGYTDASRSKPWTEDTIVNVFSCTKTVASLALLMLIDRRLVDPEENVAKYWPEFATRGKEGIKVRHILSHTSGMSALQKGTTLEDLVDFDKITSQLASQAPLWTPGTASGYHSWTFGFLIGAIVLRVTGISLRQFIREEIAKPLEADFQVGAEDKDWARISPVVPPPPTGETAASDPDSIGTRTFANPVPDANFANTESWRKAEIASANGHTNARGLARILSVLALGGTVNGRQLLSPETIELIFQEQARGVDLVVGISLRFGIGYGLRGDGDTFVDGWLPSGRICFWGGWGGSMAIVDLDRRLTIAYAMNKMSNTGLGNMAAKAYIQAVYRALGIE
ncbi:hypothetical protein AK830_g137 [Neonectria ditissima]|uniref:Beta-lactamase-related domain-containing protein n=1 Tax=Neonectria ditissima TaxID=78410 RepID=A0A0P7BYL8_9HYPO|nr:hypothetical protein AK830_g137 [Neonectria ditissima]